MSTLTAMPPPTLDPQAHPLDILRSSLVDDAFEFIVTIDAELRLRFTNPAITTLLGYDPDEAVGRPIAEFIHPDDFERALTALSGWQEWGSPAGATSFRLLHADGSWLTFDVTASTVSDGEEAFFAVYGRPADYQHATEAVLANLLTGGSRAASVAPVVDCFEWKLNDLEVAIAWYEEGLGHQFVSTGLPRELTGAEPQPGQPWALARRTGQPVHADSPTDLDPRRRTLATRARRGTLWVEPVTDITSGVPALVTIWSRAGGPPARGHAYGMSVARVYIELILRWTHQVAQLDAAAHTDSLTGLPNRRALFDLLSEGPAGGAILFCDLDSFKPVNDELGHPAGDEVLRQVARRLVSLVRADDVVARSGGDEFVVLAHGLTLAEASELSRRVSVAMEQPFRVAGHLINVGITVGVAHTTGRPDEDTLAAADRAMLETKANRRTDPPG